MTCKCPNCGCEFAQERPYVPWMSSDAAHRITKPVDVSSSAWVAARAMLVEIADSGYLRAKITSDETGMQERLDTLVKALSADRAATMGDKL